MNIKNSGNFNLKLTIKTHNAEEKIEITNTFIFLIFIKFKNKNKNKIIEKNCNIDILLFFLKKNIPAINEKIVTQSMWPIG